MSNFATTIISDKDNVSISGRGFVETEEQIDNYNHTSETVDSSNYSVTHMEKYPSFIESFKTILSNFELLNKEEILNFIFHNIGLLELIKNIKPIIKKHFPNHDYALEFNSDPEIPQFNQIILYVKGDENSFDEDWVEVKKVNKEIRKLSLYDNSIKNLFTVDLW
ncbi:hypothetical protein [Methanobrevibacter smithii]|uniref:hypothetical protein n=1 Tax=Methanobrevibacter smithii TaxID=2173 RepID=UPI0037DD9846